MYVYTVALSYFLLVKRRFGHEIVNTIKLAPSDLLDFPISNEFADLFIK